MSKDKHFLFELLEYLYYKEEGVSYTDILKKFNLLRKVKGIQNLTDENNIEKNYKYFLIKREIEKAAQKRDNIIEIIDNEHYLNPNGIALYQDYIDLKEARAASLKAQKGTTVAIGISLGAALFTFASLIFSICLGLGVFESPPMDLSDNTISKLTAKANYEMPEGLEPFCSEVCLDYGSEIKSKVWSDANVNYCLCYNGTDVVGKNKVIVNSEGGFETK